MVDVLEDLVFKLGKVELADVATRESPSPEIQRYQQNERTVEGIRPSEPVSLSKEGDVVHPTTISDDVRQKETGQQDDATIHNSTRKEPRPWRLNMQRDLTALLNKPLKETKPLYLASVDNSSDNKHDTHPRLDHRNRGIKKEFRASTSASASDIDPGTGVERRDHSGIRGRSRTRDLALDGVSEWTRPLLTDNSHPSEPPWIVYNAIFADAASRSYSRPGASPKPDRPVCSRSLSPPSILSAEANNSAIRATVDPQALWKPTQLEDEMAFRERNQKNSFGLAFTSTPSSGFIVAAGAWAEDLLEPQVPDSGVVEYTPIQASAAEGPPVRPLTSTSQTPSLPCPAPGCTKVFEFQETLNRHMRYHTRPEQCPHCPRRFGTKTHLERHVKDVHDTAARFHCNTEGCKYAEGSESGKSFARKEHLRRHARSRHGVEILM
ncbi:hypothetical protein BDZ45DRAFT_808929 [Acephala macrosclerotiorum]|nr:hypothetical protein BDZ45DRAFT_808929 [Acephala macrosclerotiorum]